MEDILREHHESNTLHPIFVGPSNRGIHTVATEPDCFDSCGHVYGSRMALTEADEDDEFGNMTLKEMHCLLRRNARKFLKKASSGGPSLVPVPEAGLTMGNNDSVIEIPPSSDCPVKLGAIELHLDSSTSNSAESGDDASPRGVATSYHKPLDSMVVKDEPLVREDYSPESTIKKRKSMTGPLLDETGISVEDDDCTLQMWQAHRRRLRGGERSGGSAGEQAGGMAKQNVSDASIKPVDTSGDCSLYSTPDFTDLDNESLLSPAVGPSDTAVSENPGSASSAPCLAVFDDPKENISLKPTHDASAEDCQGSGNTCREGEESKQGPSSNFASSQACLWECSSQKFDTGRHARLSPWSLRPCKAVDVSTSGPLEDDDTHRVRHEPITFCEISEVSDKSARLSGQSPALEELCTKICDEANSGTTGIESNLPCLEVIDGAVISSQPAVNQIVCSSQKMSNEESFPAHCSKGSPTSVEPETGLDKEDKGSQSMGGACQLSSEEIPGSPVSLFSTERLDAEEEQELEQLKPSKIPCKRKAISPLSRERLLQASKCGEPGRTLFEVDKRGFKKLPRAFKGFIGRDTSNHESFRAYTKARNIGNMESSPSEKLLQKEEVPPGSPCHNRKKYLSAKSFPSKASLPSSFGDSVAVTAVASSVQASLPSPSCVQRLSLVLNSSPSPPLQQISKPINGKSPTTVSPSIPTKGILRSSPPICQGQCKCEECTSLRCRAERAAEFSQRQMHDIEGLAVKLLKELNTMRHVIEDSLSQRNAPRVDSPRTALSLEQVRRAANSALETEKTAKSWLVRMARDCNRYCKIMRMQERKLTFADESGGQLCHKKRTLADQNPKLTCRQSRKKLSGCFAWSQTIVVYLYTRL
ncbi:hypothetical protein GOP47_0018074 [Adiantum capillus-veneris]|uniref:Uncharacterized protein n=1 Tax=Adiantum capillus-veneris TaxID=13818 RepID=A0A9D4UHS3_ADICA|nr:hypothetical protein GOP47_0018074 [Adiantum capillus-veneris]